MHSISEALQMALRTYDAVLMTMTIIVIIHHHHHCVTKYNTRNQQYKQLP